ncbi:hypothetical protein [Deinococcus ruber]|uniref:Uncharacterized protein n=1 Tax=Deinococcus ruber TaxID=1848197 RepID=A0A918CN74_9DEIO|nr:hypothetical protein [Deinococcus ruber]GGR31482.1 hypothetical protein GCM10008957_47750 [Deinococcus ruber]
MASPAFLDGSKTKKIVSKRRSAIESKLQALAETAAIAGEQQAQRGLTANVYGTEPGKYRRTKRLKFSTYKDGQYSGGVLRVILGDTAPYADKIEYGTGPHELSPAQLQQYLDVLPRGGLLRFGRSGKAYLYPGPYIGPGLIFARYRVREGVALIVQKAMK